MVPRRRDVSALAATLTGLKPFPRSVAVVRKLASAPEASVGIIAAAIERDVSVSMDLLRIANSPTSALTQKCNSVRHAATLLGIRRVCQVVESAAALAVVEATAADYPGLAARVLAVAGVARMLAPIAAMSPDDVFTAALLHDVGVLLLVQSEDPFYEGLIDPEFGDEPNVADEAALMGFDHAELGGAVIRSWNLPDPLPRVVELHHDWEAAAKEGGAVCATVALLRVADVLVPALARMPTPTLDELTPLLAEPAFAHLGLTREELFRTWDGLRRAMDKASLVGEQAPSENAAPTSSKEAAPSPPSEARAKRPTPAPERGHSWLLMGAAAAVVVAGALAAVLLA